MEVLPTAARAVAFGAAVMATSLLVRKCAPLSEIGPRDIPFQPPGWVFGVVWPLLYATTGAAWVLSAEGKVALGGRDAAFFVVTASCCAWLPIYACWREKRAAAAVLAFTCLAAAWMAAHLQGAAGGLLAPLAAWTGFATYLNAYEVLYDDWGSEDGCAALRSR